jgi:mannose-6-phosphate isomerase-like protein (cupin superfamily)
VIAAQTPQVVRHVEPLWFLGTLVHVKLSGEQTGGLFSLQEALLPCGASPPLHSHPQAEMFYVLEGEVTFWIVAAKHAAASWPDTPGERCGTGAVVFAPARAPHTFRVESETARMLYLSAPAGIEDYVRDLAEPARWPWLQPPPDGPRVPAERLAAVERAHHVVRHAAPPLAAESRKEQ